MADNDNKIVATEEVTDTKPVKVTKKTKKVKYGKDGKPKPKFVVRMAKFFRSIKSELKKIYWMPWKQVWRSTFVVLVMVAFTAVIIGGLDTIFTAGLDSLRSIVR